MTIDPVVGLALFAYGVVMVVWAYTMTVAFVRMRATRVSSPLVSRLYLVLVAGSICAIAACTNDLSRLALSTGAFGGTVVDPRQLVASMLLPYFANAGALAFAVWLAVKGWLPQIELDAQYQRERQQALEELVSRRTEELRETIEELEKDQRDRERIELELRAEHAMLDAIMKTNVGAICVMNGDGRIVFANDSAQGALGVATDELTKRSYNSPEWEPRDEDGNPLPEEDYPFVRVKLAGEPIRNMHVTIANEDGSRRVLDINGAPLFNEDGAFSGVVFLVADITKRMADEQVLRDSEQRFRLMVEDLPSGAVFVEGDRIYLNRAAEHITGYSRAELTSVDQWFWALYGGASDEARTKYEAIRDAGFVEVCIGSIRRKDGEARVIECDGYKSNHATVWLLHDVSERYHSNEVRLRSEAQLVQTQSLANLAIMAEGVAHDCNNILTGILGTAGLAQHELSADDGARPYIADIARGAERAADLCTMMMAYAGDAEPKLEAVDANAAIHEMVRFMQGPEGHAPGVSIQYALDDSIGMIRADRAQFRKVLLALLKNAAEAIGTGGGTITVSSETVRIREPLAADTYVSKGLSSGEYVRISVRDTGCGMDAATLGKAFDPFFTTKPNARGLGLTYSFGVLRASSGNISLESEEAAGTTATVYLPAANAATLGGTAPMEPERLWHGSGTILVVDDELNVRTITKRMLERLGFDVVLACDGYEAIKEVERRRDFAAVILDLTMPNLDGGAAFEEIRRNCPRLPVLIASGYDVKKVTARFPSGGVASFLQKPYPMHVLSTQLRDALAAGSDNLAL